MLALLLAAAAAASVAPAPPAPPRSPAPRTGPAGTSPVLTNIADVFTSDIYPADALRDGVEGVTRVRVRIDARGRPTACAIQASSGSASLDATGCRVMIERGKFTPARDRRNRTIAGDYVRAIRWKVETVEAPLELTDFSVKLIYALKAGVPDGACRGELSPVGDIAKLCEESRATALQVANDIPPAGRAGVSELVMFMDSRQGIAGVPAPLMGIPGMIILDERHFALTIERDGKVSGCTGGGSTLAGAGGVVPFCARFQEQKYAPSPSGVTRTVLFRSQIYARK